jgi:hypothetical protein
MSFSFVCLWKNNLFLQEQRSYITYQRLINFMMSFKYLGFLDTRLFFGQSLFSIHLVPWYKVTSRSRFWQTWLLVFRVVIYFTVCFFFYFQVSVCDTTSIGRSKRRNRSRSTPFLFTGDGVWAYTSPVMEASGDHIPPLFPHHQCTPLAP